MKKIISTLLFLFFIFQSCFAGKVTVSGHCYDKGNDSVRLIFFTSNLQLHSAETRVLLKLNDQSFTYSFRSNQFPQYLSVFDQHKKKVIENRLIEDGDSIHLAFNEKDFTVTGKGREKWLCQQEIWRIFDSILPLEKMLLAKSSEDAIDWRSIQAVQENCIEIWKSKISPLAYTALKADLFANTAISRMVFLQNPVRAAGYQPPQWVIQELNTMQEKAKKLMASLDNSVLARTFYFPQFLVRKVIMDTFLVYGKKRDLTIIYQTLKNTYPGPIGEAAMLNIMVQDCKKQGFFDCAADALTFFNDPIFRDILMGLYQVYQTGVPIAHAVFTDERNRAVSLEQFRDTVLLIDLWFTGCIPCQEMTLELKKVEDQLKGKAFRVVSISIDNSKAKWINSVRGGMYTGEEHVNLYTGERGNEHSFIKYYQIITYPTLLLVDKKGILVSLSLPDPREGQEVRQKLVKRIEAIL